MVKNPPANAGDTGDTSSIPGSGRSPGGVSGNLLQCSCLGNLMDRGAWRAAAHGVAEESDADLVTKTTNNPGSERPVSTMSIPECKKAV